MMKLFLLTILFLNATIGFGQKSLVLEKRINPKKTKVLSLGKPYIIKTNDLLHQGTITDFTETTLTFKTYGKTGKDTTFVYSQGRKEVKKVRSVYAHNTSTIAFKDILLIKKDLFNDRKWLEPFGYVGIGAGLGLVLLPIAAIDKGSAGVKEWADFEVILLAASVPPLFIGTRKVSYDLKNKWKLKTTENNAR